MPSIPVCMAPDPNTRKPKYQAAAWRVRRALPYLRAGRSISVRARSQLYAARRAAREVQGAAKDAGALACSARQRELPRRRQHGDPRRDRAERRQAIAASRTSTHHSRTRISRSCTRAGFAASASTSFSTSAERRTWMSFSGSSRARPDSIGTSCCTSTPSDLLEFDDMLRTLPVPFVIDHMGRVPTKDGLNQEPFKRLLERGAHGQLLGEDLRRRAHLVDGTAVHRRRAVRARAARARAGPRSCGAPIGRIRTSRSTCRTTAISWISSRCSCRTRRCSARCSSTTRTGSTGLRADEIVARQRAGVLPSV